MSLWLADFLVMAGFGTFVIGILFRFGPAWALIVGGGLMLSLGLVAAMRRGN